MDEDKRRDYRAILPGTEVIYRATPVRPQDRRYLLGVAENLSLGGLFISTRQTFAVGTVVLLDLFPGTGDDRTPFSARAVVRWRQLWREPRGMGLQFLDFSSLAERPMQALLDNALAPPPGWRLPAGADPSSS
jgi:c-di-GMP-binding flagellar brake protein YcgR